MHKILHLYVAGMEDKENLDSILKYIWDNVQDDKIIHFSEKLV